MAGSPIYVARDENTIVVSRRRLRLTHSRPVLRPWQALVEITSQTLSPPPTNAVVGAALFGGPPVALGALTATFAPLEIAIATGGAVFFAMSYLAPLFRRRRPKKDLLATGGKVHLLHSAAERTAFDRVLKTADRIAETWPGLSTLVDVVDAEAMLADAVWEIARVLARRQEVSGVVAELSKPDFQSADPADETVRELRIQHQAARATLAQVQAELAQREANLRRAEEAGRNLSRELEMRRAIRAAQESLYDLAAPPLADDPAAELTQQTQSVLAAYRELTAAATITPPPA